MVFREDASRSALGKLALWEDQSYASVMSVPLPVRCDTAAGNSAWSPAGPGIRSTHLALRRGETPIRGGDGQPRFVARQNTLPPWEGPPGVGHHLVGPHTCPPGEVHTSTVRNKIG